MLLPKILRELLSLPTASFREHAVMAYLDGVLRDLPGVQLRYDRCGNLLARYGHETSDAPALAFVAHTDHPGFVVTEVLDDHKVRADFRGGVRPEYFPGARVAFWHHDGWIPGRVLELTRVGQPLVRGGLARPEEAVLAVEESVPPGTLGMWALPDPVLEEDRLWARDCDDIAGVAAMVTLLRRLSRDRARASVFCLFTRAEEVGFVGAIGAIRSRTLPRRCAVISVETSSALPHAPVGGGPIVRVGDKASLFDPGFTARVTDIAAALAGRHRRFTYQRRLMDGGTCEAYPFGAFGYATSGICLALGNYHNMDTATRKIASEYISLSDWRKMVDLFVAIVRQPPGPTAADNAREVLAARFDRYEPLLGT